MTGGGPGRASPEDAITIKVGKQSGLWALGDLVTTRQRFITASWTFRLISSKALEPLWMAEVHGCAAGHIWAFGKCFQCQYNGNIVLL